MNVVDSFNKQVERPYSLNWKEGCLTETKWFTKGLGSLRLGSRIGFWYGPDSHDFKGLAFTNFLFV